MKRFVLTILCVVTSTTVGCRADVAIDSEATQCAMIGGFLENGKCKCFKYKDKDDTIIVRNGCFKEMAYECQKGIYQIELCGEDGQSTCTPDSGDEDFLPYGEKSICQECTEDLCESGKLVECISGAKRQTETTCYSENDCPDDTCKNLCGENNNNKPKCKDGTTLEVCEHIDNYYTIKTIECLNGCSNVNNEGKCNDLDLICNEDVYRCAGDVRQQCKFGVLWEDIETCPANSTCINGYCEKNIDCENGKKQCSGNTPQICEDGKWKSKEPCTGDLVCKNAECVNKDQSIVCSNGDSKCSSESTVQICKDGQWIEETCNMGCQNNACNVCSGDQKQCFENTLRTCSNGQWREEPCTDEQICDETAGKCVNKDQSIVCSNGDTNCSSENTVKICKDGQWIEEPCNMGCQNNACNVCSDNTKQCSGNTPQICCFPTLKMP